MAAQTYASIKKTVGIALTAQAGSDLDTYSAIFEAQFPQGISYAENRIYREIPMLTQRTSDNSLATVSGIRSVSLAAITPPFLTMEEISLITPAGTMTPANGTRVPYDLVSIDFLNRYWPVQATVVAPSLTYQGGRYWAMQDQNTIVFAPTPDAAYHVNVFGLVQPETLSASNTSTYLSATYPEVLEAGCLVFLFGAVNRNFGAASDEPTAAVSWEAQFRSLLDAAKKEEMRRRGLIPDFPMSQAAKA